MLSTLPTWRVRRTACLLTLLASGCTAWRAHDFGEQVERHRLAGDSGCDGPRVLAVVAHPDDEIAFAGTLFKTATALGGACDLLVITNGEAGFKYSTLAERLYGVPLTEPGVGRAHLPDIRCRELLAGCRYLGVREVMLLRERDHRYSLDPDEVLGEGAGVWDLERIGRALDAVLAAGDYDFLLTHLPVPGTHGHHKAATILALQAVARMAESARPVVLGSGARPRAATDDAPAVPRFVALEGYPITAVTEESLLAFDRRQKFGYRDRLDYQIVVNWAITEHKSQGTMQTFVNGRDEEVFYRYRLGAPDGAERARQWFEALAQPQFETPTFEEAR